MNIYNKCNLDLKYEKNLNLLLNDLDTSKLNLYGFRGIEVLEDKFFNEFSDGKTNDGLISLPKSKIQDYLKNENIDVIRSTIYHELVHIDLSNRYPNIHKVYNESLDSDDYIKTYTIIIFIEFMAHKESTKYETKTNQEIFYNSVNSLKLNFNNDVDKVYFVKYIGYILGRLNSKFDINIIKSDEIKSRSIEFQKELDLIQQREICDDYCILLGLEEVVKKYISND